MSNKHHSNMFLRSEARSQVGTPSSGEWMDASSPHSNRSMPRDAVMHAIRKYRANLPHDLKAVTKTDDGHTMNARAAALVRPSRLGHDSCLVAIHCGRRGAHLVLRPGHAAQRRDPGYYQTARWDHSDVAGQGTVDPAF